MFAIEDRLFSGDATKSDLEWLEWLAERFDGISIPEFAAVGMDIEETRRFLGVIAMARRVRSDLEAAA